MPAKVVDASIVAAWCFRESQASDAFRLLQGSVLYAPVLLAYELASIARRKIAIYPERRDALIEALATALALPIHWSNVDHMAVVRLALDTNLTTYDASYLYLARSLAVPLVTFDQQLQRASGGMGA